MGISKLYLGDCRDILKTLPENSVDSICCDPPYELGFMGKSWDSTGIANNVEMWKECLRVLKPGGHLLAFSGTRTYHRMACAIEDAGFEVRDMIEWVYGCLSEDTEILTESGYKLFKDISKDEKICIYNKDNNSFSYEMPEKWSSYQVENEECYSIKSDKTDQIVSKNHRCLVERNGKLEFVFAEQLEKQELFPLFDGNKNYNGDCLEVMKTIEDNSVDMVLTSPPYDNLRDYKGYTFDFEGIAKELYRIIKQGGVVVWIVGDAIIKGSETGTSFKQALYFKEIGFNLHDTMIYQKNSYPFPPSNRYFGVFEYMFVFSKGSPKTTNLLRVPTIGQKHKSSTSRQADGSITAMKYAMGKDTRVADNIWKLNVGYGKSSLDKISFEHPATFPEKLAEDHILSWSNEGDIILDPMAGSGTTLKMAKRNNRNYIGIEIAPEYCDIIHERIQDKPNTTLATVTKIEYSGIIFCPTVSTGAFVARRNGQVFITGNSGFPKSLSIGKAVDKLQGNKREVVGIDKNAERFKQYKEQDGCERKTFNDKITKGTSEWEGWGTATKPAHEPICMARKPIEKGLTVAENCLKWGTGGINIDESRVGTEGGTAKGTFPNEDSNGIYGNGLNGACEIKDIGLGRFPANLLHDNSEEVRECFPESKSGSMNGTYKNTIMKGQPGERDGKEIHLYQEASSGNASRFFKSILYYPKASKAERNRGCERLEEKVFSDRNPELKSADMPQNRSGNPKQNFHPTVKPIALMEYLIKMVTRKGGIVLDPFMGSGSTGVACKKNGFNFIGIDKEEEYIKIAEARINYKQ